VGLPAVFSFPDEDMVAWAYWWLSRISLLIVWQKQNGPWIFSHNLELPALPAHWWLREGKPLSIQGREKHERSRSRQRGSGAPQGGFTTFNGLDRFLPS
jgi:hypothetical protein